MLPVQKVTMQDIDEFWVLGQLKVDISHIAKWVYAFLCILELPGKKQLGN